jgi:hypothetical protein
VSRKPPPYTEPQRQALDLARRQGGLLHRNEAGWGPQKFDPKATSFDDLFPFATVRALVTRGAMQWSQYRGSSPTVARVIP